MDNNNDESREDRKKRLARERSRRYKRKKLGIAIDAEPRKYNSLKDMTEEERQEYRKQQIKENNRRVYERNKLKKVQNNT